MSAQKNFTKEADNAFLNESYYSAIELYKKAVVKEKKPAEKARIYFQMVYVAPILGTVIVSGLGAT